MIEFDWSTAEPPVWRVLGPEIAAELRRLATMPIEMLRVHRTIVALRAEAPPRNYKAGRPRGRVRELGRPRGRVRELEA